MSCVYGAESHGPGRAIEDHGADLKRAVVNGVVGAHELGSGERAGVGEDVKKDSRSFARPRLRLRARSDFWGCICMLMDERENAFQTLLLYIIRAIKHIRARGLQDKNCGAGEERLVDTGVF